MKKIFNIVVVFTAIFFFASNIAEACTIMLVTKGASADGSIFVTHSNDGFGADPNVVFVPAKNHKKGSLRPVYPTAVAYDEMPEYNCFFSPHLVAPERADAYGTAEAFFVADKNEGWLFEMQPTPSGKVGFWIAEKIPDGEFSIAANQLRIRAIREGDPNQIFNPHLPQMLKEISWAAYDAQGNLDWVKSLRGEEFNHPYYSMRRVWRGLDTVAPSLKLSPAVEGYDSDYYPLSVRPDKKLAITDIMGLHRDYYQGTEFDKTASQFAGLYGSPYHYENEKRTERGILSAKTTYSHITQVNDKLPAPIAWVSINTPLENPFVPFAVSKMPDAYHHALRDTYDGSKMFWASNQIIALSRGYWNSLGGTVAEAVRQSEKNSLELVESSLSLSKEKFAATLNKNAEKVFEDWKNLYTRLLIQYNSGAGVRYDERHLPSPDVPTKY